MADYVEALSKFPVTGDIDTFGVLVKLGLPAESLAPYAMFVLFILTGIIALGMRDDEDLLILSFLAIASCIVLVHHEYDNIVLAIPLAYVLSKKVIDVPTISFLLCIVSAWYARKILELAGEWLSLYDRGVESVVFYSIALLFYGSWMFFLVRAGRRCAV